MPPMMPLRAGRIDSKSIWHLTLELSGGGAVRLDDWLGLKRFEPANDALLVDMWAEHGPPPRSGSTNPNV